MPPFRPCVGLEAVVVTADFQLKRRLREPRRPGGVAEGPSEARARRSSVRVPETFFRAGPCERFFDYGVGRSSRCPG